jgi:hypothetical protein
MVRPFVTEATEVLLGDPLDAALQPNKEEMVGVFESIDEELDAIDAAIAGVGSISSPTLPTIMGTRTDRYYLMYGNTDGLGNQTHTTMHTRRSHRTPDIGTNISDLQLVFGNWYIDYVSPTATEWPGTIDISVRASVYSAYFGAWIPVFFNGSRDVTIAPGGNAVTDPLGVEIPPDTPYWTMTRVRIATTAAFDSWPIARGGVTSLGEGSLGEDASNTDYTTVPGAGYTVAVSGSTTSAVPDNVDLGYGPAAILGRAGEAIASVVILSDSIGAGEGDTGTNPYLGHLQRALENAVPWTNYGRPGDSYLNRSVAANHYRMFGSIAGRVTHALMQFGTNDIGANARTLAQAQGDATIMFNLLAARGIQIVACTIPPVTTSTDGWTTTVNQTIYNSPAGLNTTRIGFNNWLRGLDGTTIGGVTIHVADVADEVETARDSGIWKANYVYDNGGVGPGVHPTPTGYIAAAAAIDLAWFGA